MTTASLRRRLPLPLPQAVPPLEDDDLLAEILLRLPPLPSSLPRAPAVCTRWRGLLSDPAFRRRFRTHHRRRSSPPLIGFIELTNFFEGITFHPALDGPDRLPRGSFNLNTDGLGRRIRILGCRHGLGLVFVQVPCQLLVWDPVAGDLHRLDLPPECKLHYDPLENPITGAVLRAADADHFHVVLVGSEGSHTNRRALACVYSSETGAWGDLVSTPFPPKATIFDHEPAVLAGGCLHWQILTASRNVSMVGYAEESNAVFFETVAGVFMLHLESLQLKRLSEANSVRCHHPFELVYTPAIHDGAKVVRHQELTRWSQITQYMKRLFS